MASERRRALKRVLIANRGEIAVRIIRACREAGIDSVAVYSDADARALHVGLADSAERIGPAAALQSYLDIEAIVEAARKSGADAVHPGYGFLSERADFARAVDAAGLTFIGPPADAIERMGSKIGARALMEGAGVPIVPGQTPEDQSDRGIAEAARRIAFPVLIKASAGGGGRGMRVVRHPNDAPDLIAAARREATAAFGDGTLYVEKLIERPRHVELQVFGDDYGNVVHLFERECSLQRRHQKVVEESPSPALAPAVRERMGQAAIAAAKAAGYRNAGTIEFLLEGEGDDARFYFLEMNTRLQVEHPVTEAVTGVDLVRAQLDVAAGAPLPWTQESLRQRGHAIECRIYAEDPSSDFLPQAGPLLLYREPSGPGIRIDAGVVEGDEIGVNYDPMLAKLVAAGETRAAALQRAVAALRAFPILGIRTNIPFLLRVLQHPDVERGAAHTSFLDERLAELTTPARPSPAAIAAAAIAIAPVAAPPWLRRPMATRHPPIPGHASRIGAADMSERTLLLRDAFGGEHRVSATADGVQVEGSLVRAELQPSGAVRLDSGEGHLAWTAISGDSRWVFIDGEVFVFETGRPSARRRRASTAQGSLTAPMPATVRQVVVSPGARVQQGDVLLVLEAMKMELPVRAPGDGTVAAVKCQPGELVQAGQGCHRARAVSRP